MSKKKKGDVRNQIEIYPSLLTEIDKHRATSPIPVTRTHVANAAILEGLPVLREKSKRPETQAE